MSTALDRYWVKVDRRGPDDCWPWTAGRFTDGYGSFWDGTYTDTGAPHMVVASRWGYEQRVGPIPRGMCVLHSCDNPPCQNDTHWFVGTKGDNNRDREAKGRTVLPDNRGERHGMSRLSGSQVAVIRVRYAAGGVLQRELAEEFGVGQQQISRILRKTSWS